MISTSSDGASGSLPVGFEQEVEQARRLLGPNLTVFADERLRLDIMLQHQYHGRYVAFVDLWKDENGAKKLIRNVIAVANTPWDLESELHRLNAVNRKGLSRVFIEDTGQPPQANNGNE